MLMTRAQYAAHRGCREGAVQYALNAGRIQAQPDGRIESEKADRDWDENTDALRARNLPRKANEPSGPRNETTIKFLVERTERERTMVELKKLELAVRQKDLVPRSEVEQAQRQIFECYRALRNACLEMPDRLAAELATETDMRQVREILHREIAAVFARAEATAGGEKAA